MADKQEEQGDSDGPDTEGKILFKNHAQFFRRVLNVLPSSLSSLDSNRYGSKSSILFITGSSLVE